MTINNGYQMRAWYDIIGIDRRSAEDFAGITASAKAIGDLIEAENQRGVPAERIALAGFSQGGAMALHIGTRHPEKLAGLIALSCYLPQSREFATARSPANSATPIFMAHGTQDPVVPFPLGDESRRLLKAPDIRWSGTTIRCRIRCANRKWRIYERGCSACAELARRHGDDGRRLRRARLCQRKQHHQEIEDCLGIVIAVVDVEPAIAILHGDVRVFRR